MTLHAIRSTDFATLELELAADGGLRYLPGPLRAFCRVNGVDERHATDDEDLAMAMIAEWYVLHREAGAKANSAAETIIALLNARGT